MTYIKDIDLRTLLLVMLLFLATSAIPYCLKSQSLVTFGTDASDYPRIKTNLLFISNFESQVINESQLTLSNIGTGFALEHGNTQNQSVLNDYLFCWAMTESMSTKISIINDAIARYFELLNKFTSKSAFIGYSESLLLLSDFTSDSKRILEIFDSLPFSESDDITRLLKSESDNQLVRKLFLNRENASSIILIVDGFQDSPKNIDLSELQNPDAKYYTIVLGDFASEFYKDLSLKSGGTYFEHIENSRQFIDVLNAVMLLSRGIEPNKISFYDNHCSRIANITVTLSNLQTNLRFVTNKSKRGKLEATNGNSRNFGVIQPPSRATAIFDIKAVGADILMDEIKISGPFRIVNPPQTVFILKKDSIWQVEVEYIPVDTTYNYGELKINTDVCEPLILYLAGGTVFAPAFKSTLKLSRPVGGETLFGGSRYQIKWNGVLPGEEVFVEHSTDGGNFWNTIGSSKELGLTWLPVPRVFGNRNLIRIKHTYKDAATRKIISLNGLNNKVVSLKWNLDGTQLFTAGQDGFIRIWDPVKAEPLRTIASGLFTISYMDINHDAHYVAYFSENDSIVTIINLFDEFDLRTLTYNREILTKIHWHPAQNLLAASTRSGKVIIFNTITNDIIDIYSPENSQANDIKWSPNAKLLAVGYVSGNIAIINLDNESVRIFKNSDAPINSIAWNNSGAILAVASELETIRIWDVNTQNDVLNLQNNRKNVKIVSWDPKLRYISTTGIDSTITLWSPSQGVVQHIFPYHNNLVSTFEWSRDGKKIAGGTIQGEVLIWSPDDLPFENQVIQTDISNNPFNIVPPNILHPELDFGKIIYRNRSDSTFVKSKIFLNAFRNNSVIPIYIDSISISHNTLVPLIERANYQMIKPAHELVMPDSSININLKIVLPYNVMGKGVDTLVYYTNAGIYKSVIRFETNYIFPLEHTRIIDFGQVPLGDSSEYILQIANNSNILNYRIADIVSYADETPEFNFNELKNLDLPPNSLTEIRLVFTPSNVQNISRLLNCIIYESDDLTENSPITLSLIGKGIAPTFTSSGLTEKLEALCDDSISTRRITIHNKGTHLLEIKNVTLLDNPRQYFTIDLTNTVTTVLPNDSTSVLLSFQSEDIGFAQATISFTTNTTIDNKTIHHINVLAKRELSDFSPTTSKLRFFVPQTSQTQTKTFKIANNGTIPIMWTLPDANGLFSIESIIPMNTLPGDSSEVTVKFAGSQNFGYYDSYINFRDTCHNVKKINLDAYVGPNSARLQIPEFIILPDLICESESTEYRIELKNTGSTPLFIDNIYFDRHDFADFQITKFPESDRIDADRSDFIHIKFKPVSPGIKKTYLTIQSNAVNSIEGVNNIELNSFAGYIDLAIQPSEIYFESLIQNISYSQKIQLFNLSNIPVTWDIPVETDYFRIDSIIPLITPPNSSAEIYVTFKGGIANNIYTHEFLFKAPCDFDLRVKVFADVQKLAAAGIKAGKISAKPGDTLMLPIYLYSPSNISLPQSGGYVTTLKFKNSLLFPLTNDKGRIDGIYRVLEIQLPENPQFGDIAIYLPLLVTLGDTIETPIYVQNSHAKNNVEISIEEVAGSFTLDSLCIEGGLRLIANTGQFRLFQNYPNPANELTTFRFSVIEKGQHTLALINLLGNQVSIVFDEFLEPGLYEVTYNLTSLPMGNYIYKLSGPNLYLIKKMTILR